MAFAKVSRQPVYLQVAEQIRGAILRGELLPGSQLPSERELTVTFGVGRTTVREALRALEAQGLVSSSGGGGWRSVATPSLDGPVREALLRLVALEQVSLPDLVELRLAIESAALRSAARSPDPILLATARDELEQMRRPDIDEASYQEADMRFHVALVGASGNRAMHLVMLSVRQVLARFMAATRTGAADIPLLLRRATEEHAAILAAVERHDPEAAVRAAADHITASAAAILGVSARDAG